MFIIKIPPDFKSLNKLLRLYSISRKTHYEVLNLRRNCSEKDIKEAFIQMSKEYHPDKNKDTRAQEKFVRIVEAYNVLSKPSSRAQYDSLTEFTSGPSVTSHAYQAKYGPYSTRNNHNYNYYYEAPSQSKAKATQENTTEWYYGLKGVKKLPNLYIIGICFGLVFIGVMLQVFVIRNTYVLQRRKAQERSMLIAEELERVRATAKDNGNELQTRLLLDKIVTAANPTVTTASLGQALANEKKENPSSLLTEFGVADSPDAWCDEPLNRDNNMKAYNMKLSF